MARMKFLCDADRCIECNACVTACKNEHEVPWGINRRRVVTINDGKPGERSISMACMHCTDAPCAAVCPVNCFYTTADGVVLHSKDLCIGCGYCFYACPFGAPQYPKVGNFGSRGKMDKCTFCAGGPEADGSKEEYEKYGANRLAEGKLPLCAEMCSTKSLLAGDGEIIAQIYKERVTRRGYGSGAWGWKTAYRETIEFLKAARRRAAKSRRKLMASFGKYICLVLGAGAFLLIAAISVPSTAQQVNPTASSVKEQQLLQELNRIQGRVSIPDQRSGVLEQPAGRDWREFRNVTLRWIGGIAILGMLAALVIFYLSRGMVRLESGRSGRSIVRFTAFERFVHWLTATCFIILAISGLNITFGRPLLLPLIGFEAFSEWSQWAKYAHNYLSFPFTIGVVLIFLMWVAGNIPNKVDINWLKRGGGMVGHDHPPAYRFNAGQKAIYWIVVIGGGALAVTGYELMFPFYVSGIEGMQLAQIVHSIVAVLFVAAMLAHIYIGTIGTEGAFEAMGTGTVDVNFAREHHSLWLEEQQARAGVNDTRPAAAAAE